MYGLIRNAYEFYYVVKPFRVSYSYRLPIVTTQPKFILFLKQVHFTGFIFRRAFNTAGNSLVAYIIPKSSHVSFTFVRIYFLYPLERPLFGVDIFGINFFRKFGKKLKPE